MVGEGAGPPENGEAKRGTGPQARRLGEVLVARLAVDVIELNRPVPPPAAAVLFHPLAGLPKGLRPASDQVDASKQRVIAVAVLQLGGQDAWVVADVTGLVMVPA